MFTCDGYVFNGNYCTTLIATEKIGASQSSDPLDRPLNFLQVDLKLCTCNLPKRAQVWDNESRFCCLSIVWLSLCINETCVPDIHLFREPLVMDICACPFGVRINLMWGKLVTVKRFISWRSELCFERDNAIGVSTSSSSELRNFRPW